MSEKMTRDDVVRMAHESGFAKGTEPHSVVVRHSNGSWVGVYAELNVFAHKVIEHFLDTTGQYVTNDASREAAIQAAVEAEREASAKAIENSMSGVLVNSDWANGYVQATKDIAEGIRARGET